jgi:hypothetical protein
MWIRRIKDFVDDVEVQRVKLLATTLLGQGCAVSVSQVECAEPGCPPVATHILLFSEGAPTRSVTIHRPARQVTEHDVLEALSRSAS